MVKKRTKKKVVSLEEACAEVGRQIDREETNADQVTCPDCGSTLLVTVDDDCHFAVTFIKHGDEAKRSSPNIADLRRDYGGLS